MTIGRVPVRQACADVLPWGVARRVAAIVLAAGRGTRMPGCFKLLIEIDGRPLVLFAAEAACASRADPVVVVTGHRADEVRAALAGCGVTMAHNPDFASGLSTSLRSGLAAVPADASAAVVLLADMPRVSARHVDRLIDAFVAHPRQPIVVPAWAGHRGNPVLWPARLFGELAAIEGDVGGRALLDRHADEILEIPMPDDAVLRDVDGPADLAAAGTLPQRA